jgi:hypothetical protein
MSDEAAIKVQESILADLEELVIGTQFRPQRTVEEAVYDRIAELKKTIKMLKDGAGAGREG